MNTKNRLYPSQAETRQKRAAKAKQIATEGENLAAKFLQENGFKLLSRNYRAGRIGEIDIIALDSEGVLVFVEVKTRTIEEKIFGIPELGFEAVGYIKQRKILASSLIYLEKSCQADFTRWRYDVLVIEIRNEGEKNYSVSHIQNAFS